MDLHVYRKSHLLIVEDNSEIRRLIRDTMSSDMIIYEAEDGVQGFALCLSIQPDLVVSDVIMPNMDGYELCNKIKTDHRTSHIPVLLLTAKTSSDHQVKGFMEGADAYMTKPFSLKVLDAQIMAMISSRQKIREGLVGRLNVNIDTLPTTDLEKKFISQVNGLVEKNLSNSDFSVDQMLRHLKISDVTLNKKLKSLTGKTANSYIRSMRMKKAAELLHDELITVSEVTYQVGFGDLKYFRQCFKKEFSVNPSEYKKMLAE